MAGSFRGVRRRWTGPSTNVGDIPRMGTFSSCLIRSRASSREIGSNLDSHWDRHVSKSTQVLSAVVIPRNREESDEHGDDGIVADPLLLVIVSKSIWIQEMWNWWKCESIFFHFLVKASCGLCWYLTSSWFHHSDVAFHDQLSVTSRCMPTELIDRWENGTAQISTVVFPVMNTLYWRSTPYTTGVPATVVQQTTGARQIGKSAWHRRCASVPAHTQYYSTVTTSSILYWHLAPSSYR